MASSHAAMRDSTPATPNSRKNRMDAGCYDSIRESARRLEFSAERAVEIDDLNRLAEQIHPPGTTAGGKRLRFAAQGSGPATVGYETQIFSTGAVPTRPGNLHDSFNALVWLTFPQTKAVLNARHVTAQNAALNSPQRGPAQDALTLFDECGVIVASDRPNLLALIEDFQWKELFWRRRRAVERHMKFFLFGHGLMQQLLNPYVGLTGKALLLRIDAAWLQAPPNMALSHVDASCRALIAGAGALTQGRDLAPLPVLGIPGWAPENAAEAYYDNVQYFRPGRRSASKRME